MLTAWRARPPTGRLASAEGVQDTATMLAAKSVPPAPVIRIDVSRNRDGVTFALYPLSKDLLRDQVPGVRLWPRVFVSRETEADFKELEVPLQKHAVELLTGLSLRRLRNLGMHVEFVDVRLDDPEVIATLDP